MKKIKVIIVEDDLDTSEIMMEFINKSEDIICMATFNSAERFINKIEHYQPDVVIMDIGLPEMNGMQAIALLKSKYQQTQFLICTSTGDAEKIFESLKSGATGYIMKNASPEELLESIRSISRGGSPMSPQIARLVVNSFSEKNENTELLNSFTKREQEILLALAKGYQYREIAENLFISIETVRTYLRKIYEKLQVRSKVEAINKVFPK
jgi:DNA-binding NarL/FixJ family response regulator